MIIERVVCKYAVGNIQAAIRYGNPSEGPVTLGLNNGDTALFGAEQSAPPECGVFAGRLPGGIEFAYS